MVRRGRAPRGNGVQAELKRHLLVRFQSVEKRDRRVERFKIEVADRVFQSLEETRQRLGVDMRLTRIRDLALDRLSLSQINVFRKCLSG